MNTTGDRSSGHAPSPGEGPAGAPAVLDVRGLHVTYGTGERAVTAIDDVSFTVQRGEFVCVVGPSGCGKTTLLKTLSGLMAATRGEVFVDAKPVNGPPPGLALVFQEYTRSLLPWLTVLGNVTFPLAAQRVDRATREERARSALAEVGLSGFEEKYPWQLSGGMQQRVAIARAVAYRPLVLLMDEPFASVDAQTRAELEDLMLLVQRDFGMTLLFVTHDIDESVYLGDRVIVLSGRPTVVRRSVGIPLPHPRDQLTTKADPRFVELRSSILDQIRHERSVSHL